MDQRVAKWVRWIDGPIKASVITMHHHRHIWREVAEIIDGHGSLPESAFWEYYFNIYAETQASAVRRQADLHPDVASLALLLTEIESEPEQLTPDWWIDLWEIEPADKYEAGYASRQWEATFGGARTDHFDPDIAVADLERLVEVAAPVKAHVDRHIAHSEDPGPQPKDPGAAPAGITVTLRDVHDAVDVIGEIFRRYYSLFTAAGMGTLEPVIQHDWLAPFREPWIRDEHHLAR